MSEANLQPGIRCNLPEYLPQFHQGYRLDNAHKDTILKTRSKQLPQVISSKAFSLLKRKVLLLPQKKRLYDRMEREISWFIDQD